jgi:hypothetical protein
MSRDGPASPRELASALRRAEPDDPQPGWERYAQGLIRGMLYPGRRKPRREPPAGAKGKLDLAECSIVWRRRR